VRDPLHPIIRLLEEQEPDRVYDCTNEECRATTWFVKEIQTGHWQVGYQIGQSAFQIAAAKAICPLCAVPLSAQAAQLKVRAAF